MAMMTTHVPMIHVEVPSGCTTPSMYLSITAAAIPSTLTKTCHIREGAILGSEDLPARAHTHATRAS
eukprot:891602-Prymnesium_polylepis.1